jgi:hypothetical protein
VLPLSQTRKYRVSHFIFSCYIFSSTKSENRSAEQILPGGEEGKAVIGTGEREEVAKGVGGRTWCKHCMHVYINAKMIPVETVPGIRKGEWGR